MRQIAPPRMPIPLPFSSLWQKTYKTLLMHDAALRAVFHQPSQPLGSCPPGPARLVVIRALAVLRQVDPERLVLLVHA
jgi:hypothetical protein